VCPRSSWRSTPSFCAVWICDPRSVDEAVGTTVSRTLCDRRGPPSVGPIHLGKRLPKCARSQVSPGTFSAKTRMCLSVKACRTLRANVPPLRGNSESEGDLCAKGRLTPKSRGRRFLSTGKRFLHLRAPPRRGHHAQDETDETKPNHPSDHRRGSRCRCFGPGAAGSSRRHRKRRIRRLSGPRTHPGRAAIG